MKVLAMKIMRLNFSLKNIEAMIGLKILYLLLTADHTQKLRTKKYKTVLGRYQSSTYFLSSKD